jgi:N-acetylmuramoyl-L-alanine amidase
VDELHFNAFPSPDARGHMTLHHAKSIYGMRLARHIHAEIGRLRGDSPDLGVCPCEGDMRFVGTPREFPLKRLALLEDVPQWSVIPEPAALTNAEDLKWITKFDSRRDLGYAIAQGIIDFLDTLTLEA